jgi:hypothetical protein
LPGGMREYKHPGGAAPPTAPGPLMIVMSL